MKKLSTFILLCLFSACSQSEQHGHKGFVLIDAVIPNITYDIRYFGSDNFVGSPIDGYLKPKTYLSKEAAKALKNVQEDLSKEGLGLKVFDAYRPQKAVNHFVRWGKAVSDTLTKQKYYPEIDKKRVFELGYVAEKSGHSRGSTIDLTIINLETGEVLDMGSPWDFFGPISHHDSPLVDSIHINNRDKLRDIMQLYGFKPYSNEWWHYTLKDEPYPNTYFDFSIE